MERTAYLLAQALIRLGLVWSAVSLLRATDALLAVKWLAVALLCVWIGDWDNPLPLEVQAVRFRKLFRGSYGTDYYLSDSPPHRLGIRTYGSVRITELRDEDLSRALLAQKSVPLARAMEAGDAETTHQG